MSAQMTEVDRLKSSLARLFRLFNARQTFAAMYEFKVASDNGTTIECQPADPTIGLPDLVRIAKRPSISGDASKLQTGSSIAVGFLDGNPAKPFVAFADPGQSPISTTRTTTGDQMFAAGGMLAKEHLVTVEAMALFVNNVFGALSVALAGPWIGAAIGPLTTPAVIAAIQTAAIPPPPIGPVPPVPLMNNTALLKSAIDATLAAKLPNETGLYPGIGCPNLKGG